MAKSPNLISTWDRVPHIAAERGLDVMKAHAVMTTAHQREIFGVGPAERHSGAGGAAAFHMSIGQVRSVPYLFCDHAALIGKIFYRRDEGLGLEPGSQFIMRAFSR